MRIIAFIQFPHIAERILKNPGLRDTHHQDPRLINAEINTDVVYDEAYSQIPTFDYWSY